MSKGNPWVIIIEDHDGIYDYSETLVIRSEASTLAEAIGRVRAAAQEDFDANGTSPSGYDGGTNWHDVPCLPNDLCERHGFAVSSLVADGFFDANELLAGPRNGKE